jgi:hypothetical protein
MTEEQVTAAIRDHAPYLAAGRLPIGDTLKAELTHFEGGNKFGPESTMLLYLDDKLSLKLPAMYFLTISQMIHASLSSPGFLSQVQELSTKKTNGTMTTCPISKSDILACDSCDEKAIGRYMNNKLPFGAGLTFEKLYRLLKEYLELLSSHNIAPAQDMPFLRLLAASLAFMCGMVDIAAIKEAWKSMASYIAD